MRPHAPFQVLAAWLMAATLITTAMHGVDLGGLATGLVGVFVYVLSLSSVEDLKAEDLKAENDDAEP